MTPKQKWSHMTWHIPGKILISAQIVTPVTSATIHLRLTFREFDT